MFALGLRNAAAISKQASNASRASQSASQRMEKVMGERELASYAAISIV